MHLKQFGLAVSGRGIFTFVCPGCKVSQDTTCCTQRLCAECRACMYEGLAARLDVGYNRLVEQSWERCASILARLWGGINPFSNNGPEAWEWELEQEKFWDERKQQIVVRPKRR